MSSSRSKLRSSLLSWYDSVARDLPFRRTRDPYRVWVSEIMLQQTRVETVLAYYARFVESFPTIESLASASEDRVMAAWSGLGYYRRARLLHSAAREVVARYGGQVPRDPAARRSLPGVGRYTAGAIGSIAFGFAEPIVDGNVARVLSRLYAIEAPLGSRESDGALWAHAEALVAGPRPGAFNQALMELGATLCKQGTPACQACPVAYGCEARARGLEAQLPMARDKKPPVPTDLVALLPTRGRAPRREIFLTRGDGSLFGGLWNLPMAEGRGRAAARSLLAGSGLSGKLAPRPLGQLEHVLSHRALRVELYGVSATRLARGGLARPFALSGLQGVGVSRLTRKALSRLRLVEP